MSTLIQNVVDDAARAIGDPNKTRVELLQWMSIYNRSQRELCQKANLLPFQDNFTLEGDQERYSYPATMTVMTGISVSETPDDHTTFRYLDEIFEDEFRSRTHAHFPSASIPTEYFATNGWFSLVPMVTADIVEGGCIHYFGLPDRVEFNQFINSVIQVPDIAQDYLLKRMIIHANEARNRLVEAKAALELWNADMETLIDKLEDRSQDRRSSIAPRKNRYAGMR